MADIGADRFARGRRTDPLTAGSMVLAVDAVLLLTIAVVGLPFLLFFFADETGSWATLWPLFAVWLAALLFGGAAATTVALFTSRGTDRWRRAAAAAAMGTAVAAGILIATSVQTTYTVLALPGALFIAANLLAARALHTRPTADTFAPHVPASAESGSGDAGLAGTGLADLDIDLADLELTPDELARLAELDRAAAAHPPRDPGEPSSDVAEPSRDDAEPSNDAEPSHDPAASSDDAEPSDNAAMPSLPESRRFAQDEQAPSAGASPTHPEIDAASASTAPSVSVPAASERAGSALSAEPASEGDPEPGNATEELPGRNFRSHVRAPRRRSRGPAALHTLSGVQLPRRARSAKSLR